jgi:AraC-like DNA-binding protein
MTYQLQSLDYFGDSTLPIQVVLRDPQPEFPLHSHAFDELVIILKGTAIHCVDRVPCPVQAGDVFVISGGHEHEYTKMNKLALANILFDSKQLGMSNWDVRSMPGFHVLFSLEPALLKQGKISRRLRLNPRQLECTRERIRALIAETTEHSAGYRAMARGIFMQLVVELCRFYERESLVGSFDLLKVGDAIAHMETRFDEKISIEQLAETAHVSVRHLQRIFHDGIGCSPVEYLLRIRIEKSCELLRKRHMSVTNIALSCGFSDSNYFSRKFRQAMGISPREYRQKILL